MAANRCLKLRRDPAAAGEARRLVGALLKGQGVSDQLREAAQLVSSELVTNAYRHGAGDIELRLKLGRHRLRIEVVDEGVHQAPAIRREEAGQSGGWGLRIVDQVAVKWGVFEGTTHVWADIALA